jgi:hypothetical protein
VCVCARARAQVRVCAVHESAHALRMRIHMCVYLCVI